MFQEFWRLHNFRGWDFRNTQKCGSTFAEHKRKYLVGRFSIQAFSSMKNITQKAERKQAAEERKKAKAKVNVVQYSQKHGVSEASIKYKEHPSNIKRWRRQYDGHWQSLMNKSRRPHSHPKQHTLLEESWIVEVWKECGHKGVDYAYCELVSRLGYTRTLWGLERENRTQVYYAHPYSSFERGTNENWNGIVWRFIPKGSSFDRLTDQDVRRIANYINTMPRKRFGYKTPMDLWDTELSAILSA